MKKECSTCDYYNTDMADQPCCSCWMCSNWQKYKESKKDKVFWTVIFVILALASFVSLLITFASQSTWSAILLIAVGMLDYLFYKKAPVYIKF